ncbi:MAG: UDP-3-O-(3-hydroxymyristoyl)glucosamine N-acyltransferase [Elusimicrobia bacterium]|nr:UDP-3-O-(3-hydroxymyristoyl)glucosamine N-acyltransferase [Elusimicrobiota bacterium]
MAFKISQIIAAIGPAKFEGDPNFTVEAPASLQDAGTQNITLFSNEKYAEQAAGTKAGCLLTAEKLAHLAASFKGNKIIVPHIQEAWAKLLGLWDRELSEQPWGIDPKAVVSRTVRLGKNVSIGAMTVIEDRVVIGDGAVIYPQCFLGRGVIIGADTVIYPQVVIRERCKIGSHVIIHPGVVIGADGYGYYPANGKHVKIPQIGTVEIGDDVEIGANVTIDRATMGATRIGSGTKIDNLVQIAHNVQIGKNCLIVAQSGIAGSSVLGDGVILGGQAGVGDHIEIAAGTIVGGGAGVIGDVKEKDVLWGTPARNHRQVMRLLALYYKLPEINEAVKKLLKTANLKEPAGKH